MNALRIIASVWRSAGRGMLSTLLLIAISLLLSCEKVRHSPISTPSSDFEVQVLSAVEKIHFPSPVRIEVRMCEASGEFHIQVNPDSDEGKGVSLREKKVKLSCFREHACCGRQAQPCDPILERICTGLFIEGCIAQFASDCRELGGVCIHSVELKESSSSPPEALWESGWRALKRFPLSRTNMLEGEIERVGEGWKLSWLKRRPILRKDLGLAAPDKGTMTEAKPCEDTGEGTYAFFAIWEEAEDLKDLYYYGEATSAEEIIQRFRKEIPSYIKRVRFRYALPCYQPAD